MLVRHVHIARSDDRLNPFSLRPPVSPENLVNNPQIQVVETHTSVFAPQQTLCSSHVEFANSQGLIDVFLCLHAVNYPLSSNCVCTANWHCPPPRHNRPPLIKSHRRTPPSTPHRLSTPPFRATFLRLMRSRWGQRHWCSGVAVQESCVRGGRGEERTANKKCRRCPPHMCQWMLFSIHPPT